MKLASHLWRSRHGIYYLRYTSQTREIKRSLHTRDPAKAAAYAYQFGASLMTSPLDKALKALADGKVKDWTVKLPDGTTVATDGTAEDHQRALEALALLTARASQQPEPARHEVDADMTLERCIDDYMHERAGEFSAGTVRTYKTCFTKLKRGLGGRTPIQQIDSTAFIRFRKTLDATLHPDTVTRDAGAWRGLLDWAIKRGRYHGNNPIETADYSPTQRARLIRERATPHNCFDKADLDRLFDVQRMQRLEKPCAYFLPILALWTGARLGELASLKISDINIDQAGAWSMQISESKSAAGLRHIPLHPAIIASGFVQYIEDVQTIWPESDLVFPYLKAASKNGLGNMPGREFGKIKQALGLGDDKVFHSFRKTLISCLQYNACPAEFRRAYVGHEQPDKRDTHATYSQAEFDCARLQEVIFPALDYQKWLGFAMPLLNYQPGRFDSYLTRIRAKQRIAEARKRRKSA